ncbi:hypothetical protein EX30DRAFT_337805 [Ascodesmis nigricans]|uniref:RNA exonuclease 4 n=1 Tax=Ascodesmis nigricans TaxID=341454 RepID=A0A4S2N809_9PEZI|nr:hypothetical protein EX30DRAFT_337805 [Ascodesmis nigricans]
MNISNLVDLSSNWKLLQQRLKAGASQSASSKPKKGHPASIGDGADPSRKRKRQPSDTSDSKTSKSLKRSASAPNLRSTQTSKATTTKKAPKASKMASSTTATTDFSAAAAAPSLDSSKSISASLALWAEDNDIPAADLARAYNLPLTAVNVPTSITPSTSTTAGAAADAATLLTPSDHDSASKTAVGKYIAMDCEMVGVGAPPHESSALARVSIVNYHGHILLDCFVRPKEKVTDWRTWVSGVRPEDMEGALTFEEAQEKVGELMKDRIVVGHAIKNDLEVLLIGHPKRDIRDTSRHPGFRKMAKGRTPALKKLAKEVLGIEIQGGQHSSIEDARACMLLYRRYKDEFEREHEKIWPSKPKSQRKAEKRKKKKA